jgi:glycosyltransferase involved in cell wall biosynthesis
MNNSKISIHPLFSFIIVARNASPYISGTLSDFLKQDYPLDRVELILVDGRSSDDTRHIMENFAEAHKELKVKVLDNPRKTLSCGWNVALANAKGDIILRVDAHSSIPPDFISKNFEAIFSGEDIVGGPRISRVHKGAWPGLLSLAEGSKFGSGLAEYRNPGNPKHVDTLAHASYKRRVFEKVGGYDERLVRNQDNEIHYRMKKAGFRLFFSPAIKSYHSPRSTLLGILKQKYGNGFWVGIIMGIHSRCFGLRHVVPALFVGALALAFVLGMIWNWFPFILISVSYGACAIVFTIEALLKAPLKTKPFCLFLPFIFFLMHASYGMGTFAGLVKMPFFILNTRGYVIPQPANR